MDHMEEQVTGLWNWRKKPAGRKQALNNKQVARARDLYINTSCSMQDIADRYGVSQGVIQAVIDKKGAYRCDHPWHDVQPSTCPKCHPEHQANR
jgi:hypothetical protein